MIEVGEVAVISLAYQSLIHSHFGVMLLVFANAACSCTSGTPYFENSGSKLIGPSSGPGGSANTNNWSSPKPETCLGTDWGGEYCCVECMMGLCCEFG